MQAAHTVGEMSLEELETLIYAIIRREAIQQQVIRNEQGQRTLDDIFASIERNLISLPPGAKSSLELLRQERDE